MKIGFVIDGFDQAILIQSHLSIANKTKTQAITQAKTSTYSAIIRN
jgi:hypothetical protein